MEFKSFRRKSQRVSDGLDLAVEAAWGAEDGTQTPSV